MKDGWKEDLNDWKSWELGWSRESKQGVSDFILHPTLSSRHCVQAGPQRGVTSDKGLLS